MQTSTGRLAEKLTAYLDARGTGTVLTGVRIGELQPDLIIEAGPHARIAVESLDGRETQNDTTLKLWGYFQGGVQEVWLIDPADQTVDLWNTPRFPLQLSDDDAISSALLPGFSLSLPDIFL